MKAITIKQPWAWLILKGGKDIENRTWPTNFRGTVAIHASATMTRGDYNAAELVAAGITGRILPEPDELALGAILGTVEIVDCVPASNSPWFFGPHGFVMRNPQPIEAIPAKGALGFWNLPEDIERAVLVELAGGDR